MVNYQILQSTSMPHLDYDPQRCDSDIFYKYGWEQKEICVLKYQEKINRADKTESLSKSRIRFLFQCIY